jgi:hypothetical protein
VDDSVGIILNDTLNSDTSERPSAARLLEHPFAFVNTRYNFSDTDLHKRLKSAGQAFDGSPDLENHLKFPGGSGDAKYSSQPEEHEASPISERGHRSLFTRLGLGTGDSPSVWPQQRTPSPQTDVMSENSEIDQLLREWTTVYADNERY